ncbi:MAG: TatD family hydrolase [bacterium]|nr:TatD family hydrolase [bacterium]
MNPKYIDIHSHLHFTAFDADRAEVLKRAQDAGVWMINVGTQYDTSVSAVKLANSVSSGVFATVGLHPIHTSKSYHDTQELGEEGVAFTSRGEEFDYEAYKKLGQDPKVVGVGECGLDYYRLESDTVERQKKVFREHIRLADELGKPLMLHIRNSPEGGANAYQDALYILKEMNTKVRGDVHFFAGGTEDARAFLDYGFTLSFTGAVTFPKSKKPGMADYEELIKFTPLDMILTETDCPYITPVPHRGERNEPANVRYVAKRIAEIKGLLESEAAAVLLANARRVFNI